MGENESKLAAPEEAEAPVDAPSAAAPAGAPVADDTVGALAPTTSSDKEPGGGLTRNESSSWLWKWSTPTPPASQPGSRSNSVHGGSTFEPGALKRSNSSLWFWQTNESKNPSLHGPSSRSNSLHAGNMFGGGMNASPRPRRLSHPPSRNSSLRGGNAFGPEGSPMKRNLSFLWDWGKHRGDSADHPSSPPTGDSGHGGAECEDLAVQPPKAMMRDNSIGSLMWNWDAMRTSPPGSRDPSVHKGSSGYPSLLEESTSTAVIVEKERT